MGARNKKIVETKKKALLYAGSLIFTFFFLTITRILQAVGTKSPFWLKFLAVGLVPSQGAINYFIYKRPVLSYRKYREQHPEKSFFHGNFKRCSGILTACLPCRGASICCGHCTLSMDTDACESIYLVIAGVLK